MRPRGFTVTEMLIAVAIVAIGITVVAPSFTGMIELQRLKGVTSSLITDVQYARSEAVSRGKQIIVAFKMPGAGFADACYSIYTQRAYVGNVFLPLDVACDCSAAPGSRCTADATEVKTVLVPASTQVGMRLPEGQRSYVIFDPVTGGIAVSAADSPGQVVRPFVVSTLLDDRRMLTTTIGLTGRPTVCVPGGASVSGGYPAC